MVDKLKKRRGNYSLYSDFNSLKRNCSVYASFYWYLLLTLSYVKKVQFIVVFENCVSFTGRPISNASSIFLEHHSVLLLISVFHWRLNHWKSRVLLAYNCCYKRGVFFFFQWNHFVFMNEKLIRRKFVRVSMWNLKMRKSWLLDVKMSIDFTHHKTCFSILLLS